MTRAVPDIAWEPVCQVHADVRALFGATSELLGEDVPAPRVTLDLPADNPEPLHVFTLSCGRNFEVADFLSNRIVRMTFDIEVVCVATATTMEDAARIANAYQSLLVQVPLVDPTLGGTVREVGAPQVVDYSTWTGHPDGKSHAGYRLSYNVCRDVWAVESARRVIERI